VSVRTLSNLHLFVPPAYTSSSLPPLPPQPDDERPRVLLAIPAAAPRHARDDDDDGHRRPLQPLSGSASVDQRQGLALIDSSKCNSCTRQLGGIHGLPFTTYNQAETGVLWESLNGTWYAARSLNEWGGGLNVFVSVSNLCVSTTLIFLNYTYIYIQVRRTLVSKPVHAYFALGCMHGKAVDALGSICYNSSTCKRTYMTHIKPENSWHFTNPWQHCTYLEEQVWFI